MWTLKVGAALLAAGALAAQSPKYGVGRAATPEDIRALGATVAPDGTVVAVGGAYPANCRWW